MAKWQNRDNENMLLLFGIIILIILGLIFLNEHAQETIAWLFVLFVLLFFIYQLIKIIWYWGTKTIKRFKNNGNKYKEYLNSEAWRALKKMKLEEKPNCEVCWEWADTVHHLSYERRWAEKPEDIVSICFNCHEACHYYNSVDSYGGLIIEKIPNTERELRKRFEEIKKSKTIKRKNLPSKYNCPDCESIIKLNQKICQNCWAELIWKRNI